LILRRVWQRDQSLARGASVGEMRFYVCELGLSLVERRIVTGITV